MGFEFAVIPGNNISVYHENWKDGPWSWLASLLPPCSDCELQLATFNIMHTFDTNTFQEMDCPSSVFTRKAKTFYLTNYLSQVLPDPPLPPEVHSFMFHLEPFDMVDNLDNKYISRQFDPGQYGNIDIKAVEIYVEIKFCSRCQLSHSVNTVRSSGLEIIQVDHPGASAT